MEKLDEYKEITKLYPEEREKIDKKIRNNRKPTLEMFAKYFDYLWW